MRVIGLDLHRAFAEVAILEKGVIRHAGKVALEHTAVMAFAKALKRSDEVVVEATGNTAIVVRLLKPYVRRVTILPIMAASARKGARMLVRYLSKPPGPSQGNLDPFAPSSRG
jgi:hypothetical protein